MSKRGTISKEKLPKGRKNCEKRSKINSELFEKVEHLTTDKTGKIFKI